MSPEDADTLVKKLMTLVEDEVRLVGEINKLQHKLQKLRDSHREIVERTNGVKDTIREALSD